MITLTYDAKKGTPYRDGSADLVIARAIAKSNRGEDVVITTATDNVLHSLRVAVRNKRIPLEQVTLQYHQYYDKIGGAQECVRTLKLYPSGGISPWPSGFADYLERWLMELL